MDDAVDLAGVSRVYALPESRLVALEDVTLAVGRGTFVAVMGATGSGKSTLLRCAAGLERPTAGSVRLAGRDLGRMTEAARTRFRRRRVGFVFQSYNLLSELTVEQNVLLPLRLGAPAARTVDDVLGAVGLRGTGRRPVAELSGGQRQRVAIARALVTGPALIFADEPTGSLDPTTGAAVLRLLRRAVDDERVTVVMVTHDPGAAATTDRLVLLRAGRVAEDRPTPEPATIAAALASVSAGAVPVVAG